MPGKKRGGLALGACREAGIRVLAIIQMADELSGRTSMDSRRQLSG